MAFHTSQERLLALAYDRAVCPVLCLHSGVPLLDLLLDLESRTESVLGWGGAGSCKNRYGGDSETDQWNQQTF
ncbi:MAG: hypothetical protein ACOC7K_00350 [bacterium]